MVGINYNSFSNTGLYHNSHQKNPLSFGLSKDRRPIFIINHKSGATLDDENDFKKSFSTAFPIIQNEIKDQFPETGNMPEIVVAPPSPFYLFYEELKRSISQGFSLASQNCLWSRKDPHNQIECLFRENYFLML